MTKSLGNEINFGKRAKIWLVNQNLSLMIQSLEK